MWSSAAPTLSLSGQLWAPVCISCIFIFYKCFDQMSLNVVNEEARIAQVANINQLPGTDGRGDVEHLLIFQG